MKSKKTMGWTLVSIVALLATGSANAADSMTNSLTGYTGTSTNATTVAALAADGLLPTDTNTAARAITFDSFGATFPLAGNPDANYIATVDSYGDVSFVAEIDMVPLANPAYVPFFMGIGTGAAAGEWGVPDLGTGVDSIFVENNGGWYSGVWRQKNGVAEKLTPEDDYNRWLGLFAGHATVTYNAASQTVAFEIVRNEDTISYGPFSTAGMFDVYPSRIFFGGKDIVLSGLKITLPNDTTAPPDPDFASLAAIGDNRIGMSSTTVVDDFSGVEYNFRNITLDTESGWQSNTNWADTGLTPSTTYFYTVQARDTSANTNYTGIVTNSAATLAADTTIPSPVTMSFASPPTAVSPTAISMTATTATDASGVEYLFENLTTVTDSGWQSSPTYQATGLDPETEYTFRVTARDLSYGQNETAPSPSVSATTPVLLHWMVNSLEGYAGDTTQQATLVALGGDSLEYGTPSGAAAIGFDGSGATFGEGTNYFGRNVLRTIGQDYDESSFEAYATFVFDGANDQAAFMGLGNGIIDANASGNYGVPELALAGVNGVVAEMKTSLSAGAQACNLLKINDGSVVTNYNTAPLALVDTFRVKLAYDAALETATISVDTNYTGGAFVEDRVLGTIETTGSGGTNMWYGSPARVYVGGGEGTVVRDLLIKADPADVIVGDLGIASSGGGMELSWDGLVGQTYDVLYKTDLVIDPTWTVDTSPGCSDIFVSIGGTMSATSAVSGTAVFYKVIAK